jgi:MFS family permease
VTAVEPQLQVPPTRLWSIPAWRYSFPAALVSRLGDVVFDITVVLWISTEIARGQSWAPAAVSGVLIAAAVPVLVVGPFAGVYVDRHDRHQVLVVSNLVQAAAIGSLLLIPMLGDDLSTGAKLTWIYVAVALANAAGQFFTQARLVMIARTIPDALRTTAFSVQGSANNIVFIVGPPLAAPLLFTAGVGWSLAIDAASFLVSSVLLQIVRWDSAPAAATTSQKFAESLLEGARALFGNRLLLAITLAVTVATLGTGAINVLEVFFVVDVLHRQASLLGVLNMMFAAGSIAGMAGAPWLERRLGAARIFVWGLALSGLVVVAYSRTTSLWPAMALYFLMAVPIGALNTAFMPLFMRGIPEEMLGRASVALQVFPTVASLVAMGTTGWLVSTTLRGLDVHALGSTFGPVDTVFTFAGLLFVVTALVVWGPVSRSSPSKTGSSA